MTRKSPMQVAIVSDIHYASAAEAARRHTMYNPIRNPLRRWAVRQYRRWVWLRDPFAHNYLLDQFLVETSGANLAVANGDYSCDSAYVGVSDDAAFRSAVECLQKLQLTFGSNLRAGFGDHEIGKKMLAADEGGVRLASYFRAERELHLEPLWQMEIGNYMLVGVVSTLLALPVYESEALLGEVKEWQNLRARHVEEIRRTFNALKSCQRILLFCHDPTALPFLGRIDAVRDRLPQIECTIIGHLHSRFVLKQSRLLSGMPPIRFLGHTPKRLSSALREARHWKPFNVLLCPSLAGIELLKDGGYYTVEIDPDAKLPAQFEFHPLKWRNDPS